MLKPPTSLVVPSFLLEKLTEICASHGIDPKQAALKAAICIGESLRTWFFSETPSLCQNKERSWTSPFIFYLCLHRNEPLALWLNASQQAWPIIIRELHHYWNFGWREKPCITVGMPGKKLPLLTLRVEAALLRFKLGILLKGTYFKCSCGKEYSS